MNQTNILSKWLVRLLAETFGDSDAPRGFYLDTGQSGLLAAIQTLNAPTVSTPIQPNEPTIAAHCGHLLYSLQLFNAYEQGQRPTPNWASSWDKQQVTKAEWETLQANLATEYKSLIGYLEAKTAWPEPRVAAGLMLLAHAAYHVGQIRQLITLGTNA